MKNKGMMSPLMSGVFLLLVIVVAGVALVGTLIGLGWYSPGGGTMQNIIGGATGTSGILQTTQVCDANGQADINVRWKNGENTASAEFYATNSYLYKKVGSDWVKITNITTTSDGSYAQFANEECLDAKGNINEYKIIILSADGASGDNNYIGKLSAGDSTSSATVKDGVVYVKMLGDAYITGIGSQHATLGFRMKDLNADALMYDTGDTEAVTYETTGVVFSSGTSATVNMTVAGGGSLDVDLQIQGVQSDTLYGGDGPGSVLMFINGDVATWTSDGTSVKCDGGATKLEKAQLTKWEQEKYSNQEFVYKLDAPISDDPVTHCEIKMKAQAAPGSNYCPVITLLSRGNFVSTTSGDIIEHSAVGDDSSYTVVFTAQSVTIEANVNDINGCTASS